VVTSPIVDGQPGGAPRLQWDAEQPVPASLAAELIGRQFPRLRGTPVEPLATGWDNTVYLVGGQWVFRFPRRAIALPGIQREIAVLPLLAPHLPLPCRCRNWSAIRLAATPGRTGAQGWYPVPS
jgi:aminoglycoside phosphotransferase (APT) family kinase protein